MDKLKEKIVEWGEALLAPFILFLYRDQVSALASDVSSFMVEHVQLARIWWNYNLPGRVRPLLLPVLLMAMLSWFAGSLVFWGMHVPEAGFITYGCWTVWSLVLGIVIQRERVKLGKVKPITRADLEKLEADTVNMTDAEARAEREQRFGPMRVLGLRALALVILGYLLIGIGLALMGSFSNLEGNPWPVTAQFILFAILAAFISLFAAMLTAVILGTAFRVVGSIVVALFKGGWDSVLTMLPNVEGEEAKELLPKDLDKQLAQTWKLFKEFLLSAPGVLILGVFALGIVWHHPLIVSLLLLAFIGLMSTTTFSIAMGNDEAPARKRAGKIVAWFFTGGFLYRCAEMWYFGLPGGTWYWNYDSVDSPLAQTWNRIVPWWNGFMNMSWWQALLVVAVLVIAIMCILKMPGGKWFERLKYGLVGVCGALIAATMIGFIANRASVDASISTIEIPATTESTDATTETAEAPAHVPDAIERMTGTAEAPTPIPPTAPVVPAAVPATHVVERRSTERASAPSAASADPCESLERSTGLTDLFRESMRRRFHCGG